MEVEGDQNGRSSEEVADVFRRSKRRHREPPDELNFDQDVETSKLNEEAVMISYS